MLFVAEPRRLIRHRGSFRDAPHLFSITVYLAPSLHVKKTHPLPTLVRYFIQFVKTKA
jgi:hypothetical protein